MFFLKNKENGLFYKGAKGDKCDSCNSNEGEKRVMLRQTGFQKSLKTRFELKNQTMLKVSEAMIRLECVALKVVTDFRGKNSFRL